MKDLFEIIKDHISYKQQIFKLAKADLAKTYRGAALGWSWAIIKPAVTIFVYWFAFSVGFRAGIIPWFYMSEMITQGTDSIRKYSYLVTKMKFPVSTIPTFVSISKLIVHLILLLATILIFIFMGYPPSVYMLQLPIYILFSFAFFTVFALFSSLLSCMSKDFSNLIKSFVTAIFWLSGILWDINTIDIAWVKKILMFNPVTYLSNGYRNCFIYKTWFFEQPKRLLYFALIFLVLVLMTLWAYKKLRKEIPDVLN